jgi:uncharacterized surface protein with fasciclin (FAS1) repeats
MKKTVHLKKFVLGAVVVTGLSLFASACSPMTEVSKQSPSPAATTAMQQKDESANKMMEKKEMNIVETAQANGSFATLLKAAQVAGLVDELSTLKITVLAPTDAAFAKVPKATLDGLLADPMKLAEVLKYHVIVGEVPSTEVVKATSVTTLQGSPVKIKVDGSKVMINDSTVTTVDIKASNGIIHVIDTVLLPPAK